MAADCVRSGDVTTGMGTVHGVERSSSTCSAAVPHKRVAAAKGEPSRPQTVWICLLNVSEETIYLWLRESPFLSGA